MTAPELLEVPAVIPTERLMLRCPAPGDGAAWSEAVQASLPELRPWMEWAHQTPLDAHRYELAARRAQADFLLRKDLVYLITDRHAGTVLGSCGIHRIHWALPKGDIGYFLDSRHVGRGLVTEAVAALTALALGPLAFQRIEIRCDVRNERSSAVARRLGYALEGTLRHDRRWADDPSRLSDTLVFAQVRQDGF
jgi:RimJ/RimL family protein N-acetyltransferase